MANETDKNQDIAKAIEAMVEEHLKEAAPADAVQKSMPVAMDENGGKDKIRSGSPYSEAGNKKSPENEGSHTEQAGKEKAGEAGKGKKEMKKSEEELKAEAEAVEKAKKEKEDKEKKDKDEEKEKAMKAYKSLGDLDEEEIELVKAWREEKKRESEEVTKSAGSTLDLEAISKTIQTAVEPLKKAIEAKDSKIEELEKSLKKLASQPAYDKRSISTLETVEKAGTEPEISKSQVLNKMLQLQMAGKGVSSNQIIEFEATGNISDPGIKKLVMEQFK